MINIEENLLISYLISKFDKKSIIDDILNHSKEEKKNIFIGLNADCFNLSTKNNEYLTILQSGGYRIYPDGMSIVWAMKFLHNVKQERIVTTDLILYLLERIRNEKMDISIGFVGGNNNIAEGAKKYLNQKFNIGAIKFSYEPSFISLKDASNAESMEVKKLIDVLKEKPTDIIFLGFGCPKQEILSHTILKKIPQKVIITCGGLFSYYSGHHERAPLWMQNIGLEWFFRLYLEPKRLWKRYLIGNFIFLIIIVKNKFKHYFS